ncbi:MAG: C40 family peptidase [Crocinitomicaceae bacterium]
MKGKNIQIKIGLISFLFFLTTKAFAQVPEFDRLEQLFYQKHYKIVYRKANRLLNNPEFDYSKMPLYYRSISVLELASNPLWLKRNEAEFERAIMDLIEIKKTEQGSRIFDAHINELSALKLDLDSWLSDIKRQGNENTFSTYKESISKIFLGLQIKDVYDSKAEPTSSVSSPALASRFEMVKFAQKQLGVPYVTAGESPSGFDCSGFTCYVMASTGRKIPRRAKDQYDASIKLKPSQAKMGDLVFFSNGGDISHVGMLINEPGQTKKMIHASSSKGISIVEIESSDYWTKRLVGYGSFIEN